MKKIIIPFFCAIVLMSSANVNAQTATAAPTSAVKSQLSPKQVIDKYIDALGGKAKLESVKTTITENTMSVQGMEISMNTKKMGNKFKSVQSVMGQEVVQMFDGDKGYINQMGTKSDFPASAIPELKKARTVDALGYDAANFKEVTVEKIDGKDYNVLSSDKGKFYFDTATGLLYKSNSGMGDAIIKSYLTVDGIKFPGDIEAEGNGQKVAIKTTKVTINSGVTDIDFK
ncbi:hypothetical protein [Chryseobacterium luquanense]|uniref:DUF4292 domain-containing protein n=1 Tax=Chryseobacterium luquanense TaxID=2983766 RepID=A0ABT3Y0J9_9FLAO|nr:hypothetical protein [Chryseobacterium luquanense]MCX8531673.1 hypothetical protein [Chryseobacterium luquanense]